MDPRVLELPRPQLDKQSVTYLCPFGCTEARGQDENGYCRHLVGYTDDRQKIELRTRTVSKRTGATHEQVGLLTRAPQTGDRLVGTYPGRVNKSKQHTPPTSFRVYRQDGKAPVSITDKQLADVEAQRRLDQEADILEPDAELV